MKFREGNLVEVLRRHHGPRGSWFPGSVVSARGNYCKIRYKSLSDNKGEPVMEKVREEDVRPQPPRKKRRRWMAGDAAEIFDFQCWREGKIAKVLNNNLFVVRLLGSIQLKEFHGSSVRVQQAWHNNNWSVIGKVAQNKEYTKKFAENKSKHPGSLVRRALVSVTRGGPCLREKDGQKHVKDGQHNVKMDLDRHHLQRSSKDLVSCMEGCHKQLVPNLPFFEGADNISPEKLMVDEKFKGSIKMNTKMVKETTELLYTSSTALLAEDSNQSSVASCSSNGFADSSSHNFQTPLDNASHESDAGSSFLSFSFIKRLTPYFEQKLEAEIHELEFHAYRSTVQALYASGPLSWEQESLLTNLRLSLHISDEEHLLHLRQLLSTQVL
ncbi:PLANT TUDOR-LIKE RNA-BINDING PROTEIN [Salix purpurea]|uniref:PLANT TUDOR-LIKE RNA-BINDING PROTEIN n=1 Tax=Salix purpurea TaxID=77065 RepID=A0A9Q0WWK7_SALPP|nr:PLANT TUDOR-LIKE RNA-BINDING PROTEIN [Salix purpurea]